MAGLCANQAAAIEPYQEYRKHIESAQNLTALKDDLMGDNVSLYNGKTEFAVTDITLPGNNSLPVQMRRRFSVELDLIGGTNYNANLDGVGGWEVDVPSITGTFPASGWGENRCSGHMVPSYPPAFQLTEIWQGNQIHIPGEGDRAMLGLNADTPRPDDGVARKWTTAQRDAIDCIPMKSGLAGEGYRVKTTERVSYYFDTATSRLAGIIDRSLGFGGRARVSRMRIYVQASRIEDRFGNWVQSVTQPRRLLKRRCPERSVRQQPKRLAHSSGRPLEMRQKRPSRQGGRSRTMRLNRREGSTFATRGDCC